MFHQYFLTLLLLEVASMTVTSLGTERFLDRSIFKTGVTLASSRRSQVAV